MNPLIIQAEVRRNSASFGLDTLPICGAYGRIHPAIPPAHLDYSPSSTIPELMRHARRSFAPFPFTLTLSPGEREQRALRDRKRNACALDGERFTLSPRERAGVRGKKPSRTRGAHLLRSAVRLCAALVLLLVTGLIGRAQSTNTATRPDYQSFKIISDRNIFDPNRSTRSSRRSEGPRPAKVESFALVGTMSYEKGTYAFFDGTGSSYRKTVKTGDTIAGYKVAEIAADRVKLAVNGQQIELNVGVQMKKQDEGEWQVAGRAESFSASSPGTAPAEKSESASNGEENDVLKKLMQKREQELK